MNNIVIMKKLDASEDLIGVIPNIFFAYILFATTLFFKDLVHITLGSIFHDNIQVIILYI